MIPNCNQQVIMHNGMMGQFVPFQAPPTYPQPVVQTPVSQQLPSQNQVPTLRGRAVEKEEDIAVNEVPMDGAAIFPLTNGKEIYIKSWNSHGTIDTIKYILDQPNDILPVPESDPIEDLRKDMTERFDKLEKLYSRTQYPPRRPKREDGDKDA